MTRAALAAILLAGLARPAAAEVRGAWLAVRSGYDVGSVAVPDTESGLGLGASLRLALGDAWLLGLDADIAGYTGAADGDPILHLAVSATRRWELGSSAASGGSQRPYASLGAGVGVQGLASG